MFSAGSETSATAVDWAITEMIKTPRVMKTAQNEVREVFNRKGQIDETCIREMKYLNLVIRETLRLHPPIPLLLPRECGEKCEIDGNEIPVKSKVPQTNFEYIPFGAGRRICPGISYGLANVELPLAFLLYHFDWKLPNGMKHEDLDMPSALLSEENKICT
ncbi:hypothetical protein L3X38_024264 [Prunus dulcis]|uniref:Uncharacterized protein n=1 Tax=Prunus dulcis TaxID=3755 RepID=A0AAD4Z693_PRUDU|nr:hypothetical protein L3X38_024264 [Prunus dulcis]